MVKQRKVVVTENIAEEMGPGDGLEVLNPTFLDMSRNLPGSHNNNLARALIMHYRAALLR